MTSSQFHRLAERQRKRVCLFIDGRPAEALEGDTLLTAILLQGRRLNRHEADRAPRAGFCLMGACQDCLVAAADGQRLRACATYVCEGMRVFTDTAG